MASYNPPKKNTEYIFYISLRDQSDVKLMKSAPTIAAGDFKVSTDGGALANLSTLPTVTPAASKMVKITLSTSEMNGDNVTLVCSDASGAEWSDLVVNIQTVTNQFDDLNTTTPPTAAAIRSEIDSNSTQLAAIVDDTNELQTDDVPGLIDALNDLSAAQVNAEVDTALADIHLDHLLATDYDPASKPGTGTALLNELVESDGGVSRFTANALEQGPSGGGGLTLADFFDTDSGETYGTAVAGSVVKEMADNAGGSGLTLTDIADAVLDEIVDATAPANAQTMRELLRLFASALLAKTAANGASGKVARDLADSKNRIEFTVSEGYRTAVTLDGS